MELLIFTANQTGNKKNCYYPNRVVAKNAAELQKAVMMDHVCAEYRNDYRSNANFMQSVVAVMDCDNDHSELPGDWMTPDKLEALLPTVAFAIAPSRGNMKEKDGKPARPRFHVYFFIHAITDSSKYAALKRAIRKRFPFFDGNALDAGRFIYGADAGECIWHDGGTLIDDIVTVEESEYGSYDSGVIAAGMRNSTLSRFAGRVVVRYGAGGKAYQIFREEAMQNKRLKCYIYIRISTAMQVDGYSLEAQSDRLTKYAEFQGMEVVKVYCDAGKSRKNITGRPEFTQMLQDVADGKDDVNYILVFKLSRFGRNAADVLNSLQYIQDFGVSLICVEDGIDSSKDSGKLTITVLSAVAEIERENIRVQTMEGRKQKAREGKWNGGIAPFGYELDSKNSTLIINPEEAKFAKIIYRKYIYEDMRLDTIANFLNERGYKKKKNRKCELDYFTIGMIKNILDNPVYV